MVAHPMTGIVAGLACLGVGAATVTAVAVTDDGEETSVEEQSPPASGDPQKERYQVLDDLRHECATRVGVSCTQLGLAYETQADLWGQPVRGDGLIRDDRKAMRYFRLACDYGDGNGCFNLGRMYEAGKGASRSAAEAKSAYTRACASIGGKACEIIGKPVMPAAPKLRF